MVDYFRAALPRVRAGGRPCLLQTMEQAEDQGDRLSEEELFAFCRQHLAPHKTPRYWEFVDSFPMTPSGKVQKFVLRDRFVAAAAQTTA